MTLNSDIHYDAVIIGSGQGGTPLARHLARQGNKTGLIERKHVGGTCVNEGCTPTKTMIASARVAYLVDRADDYGVLHEPPEIDLAKIRERKREVVESFRKSNLERIRNTEGLELLRGTGSFIDSYRLQVNSNTSEDKIISAEQIFINTGARPAIPPISGLEDVDYLDSTSIMELAEVPQSLLIIGGGYVGVEFGQMFSRFGSDVFIFQRGSQLLPHEDRDIAEEVLSILKEDGIEVFLNSEVQRVSRSDGNRISLTASGPDGEIIKSGSQLLIATGRRPNTEDLNLEATGVQVDDRGYIQVNGHLETDQDRTYALGDVKGGPAFTHISYDDFRVIRTNLSSEDSASISDRIVPYTVFTDPQLGRVGMTEEQARSEGYEVKIAKLPVEQIARAIEVDETRGVMKAVVDGESDQILGAAVLGIDGGEISSAIQIAMMGDLTYRDLKDGVFAHPTTAESLNNLFMTLGN